VHKIHRAIIKKMSIWKWYSLSHKSVYITLYNPIFNRRVSPGNFDRERRGFSFRRFVSVSRSTGCNPRWGILEMF